MENKDVPKKDKEVISTESQNNIDNEFNDVLNSVLKDYSNTLRKLSKL